MKIISSITALFLAVVLVACSGGAPEPTIESVSVTPSNSSTISGSSQVVFADVNGTGAFNKGVTWTSSAGTLTKITGSINTFIAPTVTTATSVTITATSSVNPSKTDTAIITVNPIAISSSVTNITASAVKTTLNAAENTALSAIVTGIGGFSNAVNWSIVSGAGTLSGATGPSISFTAPSAASANVTIVRASSLQDSSKTSDLTLNIGATAPGSSVSDVGVTATSSTLEAGASSSLTATVTGINSPGTGVLWSIVSGAGSLSATTGSPITFTAPSLSSSSITIIRATSVQDPSKSGIVSLTINALTPPSSVINITASAVKTTLNAAENMALTVVITGTGGFSEAVNWSIVSGLGTLSVATGSSISFTAPSLSFTSTTIIRATSVQDPSKTSDLTLTVNAISVSSSVTTVTVSATPSTLEAGAGSSLTATVTGVGSPGTGVLWSIVSGAGSLSAATGSPVTFTAPTLAIATSTIVRATSVQDPNKWGEITLNINASLSKIAGVSIGASLVALREAETSTLVASVTGTGAFDNAVTWAIETGGAGSLSSNTGQTVTYTAPTTSFGQVVRIMASSVQDPTKRETLFVSINPIKASIQGGENHSLALKTDGTVLGWGYDIFGQLGRGIDPSNPNYPNIEILPAIGVSNIVAIAAGGSHSLALKSDGTLLSWGSDRFGQLGDGTIDNYNTTNSPIPNPTPAPVSVATNIIAIAAGGSHSLALKSDGTLLSWGNGYSGQLGNGSNNPYNPTPAPVSVATNIVAIAAGIYHSLALKSDGTLLSWGNDDFGQLGKGMIDLNDPTPSPVIGVSHIVAIAAGEYHSLALKSDGTLVSWGNDDSGQLGDGTSNPSSQSNPNNPIDPIPSPVIGASNIIAIAAGGYHSLALKSDGTLLSWGNDFAGQLGDGTRLPNNPIPSPVSVASGIVAIAAGKLRSLALKSDGSLLRWGNDSNDANQLYIPTPTAVPFDTSTFIRVP